MRFQMHIDLNNFKIFLSLEKNIKTKKHLRFKFGSSQIRTDVGETSGFTIRPH